MKKYNMTTLALIVSLNEGLKKETNIAQIREVIKHTTRTMKKWRKEDPEAYEMFFNKIRLI